MCFSAEASFTAAAVLGVMGGVIFRKASTPEQKLLSCIPLGFALQQFCEGVLWVSITSGNYPSTASLSAQFLYLLIALVIWPILLPLSVGFLEPVQWRRRVVFGFMTVGVLLACYNLLYIASWDQPVKMVNHSLQFSTLNIYLGSLYVIIATVPFLFSSIRTIPILGILGLLAVGVTWFVYYMTFSSVWCFFAALISLFIYRAVRQLSEEHVTS